MEIINKYPELAKQLEALAKMRRDEILANLAKTDDVYKKLCSERADASMVLKKELCDIGKDMLLEKYSDTIYTQELYELDALYKQAIYDILNLLHKNGII